MLGQLCGGSSLKLRVVLGATCSLWCNLAVGGEASYPGVEASLQTHIGVACKRHFFSRASALRFWVSCKFVTVTHVYNRD